MRSTSLSSDTPYSASDIFKFESAGRLVFSDLPVDLGLSLRSMLNSPPKPAAVCTGCGTFTNSQATIGRPYGGKITLGRVGTGACISLSRRLAG